jgi:PAS domain-containing protein
VGAIDRLPRRFATKLAEGQRIDRELRISEARYRSLVAATSAIVWTTDANGRFIAPQPSWEAFTGQVWPDYAGSGRLRSVHPADRRVMARAWIAALAEAAGLRGRGPHLA